MSRCSQIVAQTLTAAAFLSAAAHLPASPSTAYVTICCNAPSTAEVVDTATLKQTRTIVTGSGGDGLAISPDGAKMFVTVDYKRELQVIATATGAILATVPVPLSVSGEPPLELAISPDGSHVFVFAPQDSTSGSLLLAIDTTTYSVTATSTLPYGGSLGLSVSPDGTQIYFVTGYANEAVQVLDAATLAPVKQIPINGYPTDLALTPSGLILIPNTSQQLLVVDPVTSIVTTLPIPTTYNQGTPGIVASSPDSSTAYLSSATGSILAMNIATGATVFFVPVSYIPTHFAVSPDGTTLYSSNRSDGGVWSLAAFSIAKQTPVARVRQMGPVSGLSLTGDGGSLYILNANQSAIAAVDVASRKATHVSLGSTDIGTLAIPPGSNILWASNYSGGLGAETLFLDPATWQFKYTVDFSGEFVFNSTGTIVYVYNSGNITAYDVATRTPLATAYVGQLTNLGQAILSPDGARLYLNVNFVSGVRNGGVEFAPGAIYVLDTATFKYTSSVSVRYGLGPMALTPDGSTIVYAANFGRVHLLSTATYQITGTVQLAPSSGLLESIALSPDGSTAYVADALNNLLFTADLKTLTQTAAIAVGSGPSPVVVSPDGSQAWVSTLSGLEIVDPATGQVSSVALPGEPGYILFAP